MAWRSILKNLGFLEIVVGILMLSVPFIDLLSGEEITYSFLVVASIIILVGYLLSRIEAEPLGLLDGIITTSLAWIIISLEASIPLMISLRISFVDAWFETVSGFTGTGFTVLTGLDHMKPSIVTWRSIMQWSGELGVVVFAMLLFPYFYRYGAKAYGVERPLKIEATFYRTAQRLVMVYMVLTIAGIISYIYTGMNFYEAFNHVLTTVATGGMSTYDAGYQVIFERAPYTYVPVFILMFLGGMNFVLLDKLIRGDIRSVLKSEEFQTYTYSMVFLTIITILSYIFVEGRDISYAIVAGAFNLVSGMTTTGFSIGSISNLKPFTKFIIIVAMFIGGMTFSTAGGIKAFRLLIIFKKLKYVAISTITIGRFEKRVKVDESIIDESEVSSTLMFPLVHLTAIMVGAALMTLYGYSFIDALFEATSAAGCVGLSAGVLTPTSPLGVKLIIITLMLLGRIEYVQLFLIIGYLGGRGLLKVLK